MIRLHIQKREPRAGLEHGVIWWNSVPGAGGNRPGDCYTEPPGKQKEPFASMGWGGGRAP